MYVLVELFRSLLTHVIPLFCRYHLGTIRALIQSKLYRYIRVVSGTSGGSIAAACCACFTEDEIMNDICVSTVSTDFRRNGEMKKQNIRWFPPVADMISYWFENKLLVDSKVRCFCSTRALRSLHFGHTIIVLLILIIRSTQRSLQHSTSSGRANSIGETSHSQKLSKRPENMFVFMFLPAAPALVRHNVYS